MPYPRKAEERNDAFVIGDLTPIIQAPPQAVGDNEGPHKRGALFLLGCALVPQVEFKAGVESPYHSVKYSS